MAGRASTGPEPLAGAEGAPGPRGRGRGRRGPRRRGSGRAGGAAPEESASGRDGRRLAPPRETERAAGAPATETPAGGGASTSEEGGRARERASERASERAQPRERARGWGEQPSGGEGPPPTLVLCPRAPAGPGERRRRLRAPEVRGREPDPGARRCPAGAAPWRAGHPACAGKRCADFFGRHREAERGCEPEDVCEARAGAGASVELGCEAGWRGLPLTEVLEGCQG